jgi:hypothetical protein
MYKTWTLRGFVYAVYKHNKNVTVHCAYMLNSTYNEYMYLTTPESLDKGRTMCNVYM